MIDFNYPYWYILLCLLVGAGFSFLLYRKETAFGEDRKALVYLLATLRFLSVTTIALLLLEPIVSTQKQRIEKPIVVIAQDASKSIELTKDSAFYRSEYLKKLNQLVYNLQEKYTVKTLGFGSGTTDSLPSRFTEKETDISAVFESINAKFYGRNLGAVILATDGIYNKGTNPEYSSKQLKNTVIYTIAMGDTVAPKDVVIQSVFHNEIAFAGNDFPVEINLKANYCKGEKTKVSIFQGNKLLKQENILFNQENDVKSLNFILPATQPGKQKYTVKVSPVDNETTTINNSQDFFITVVENKQNILLLANAPHPDIATWKEALNTNKNYNVNSYTTDAFKEKLDQYSLIILFGIPNKKQVDNNLIQQAINLRIPVLICSNKNTAFSKLNDLKWNFSLVASNDFITSEASLNRDFKKFQLSDDLKNLLNEFPPLHVPFAHNYRTAQSNNVLFFQKINGTNTNYPLFLFNEKNNVKTGVLLGEGIWRWRLYDYLKNNSHALTNELIQKITQYLATKKDLSKFRVFNNEELFENEQLTIDAELYNDSYERVNIPDVSIVITNDNGEEYSPKIMARIENSYRLNAGMFPVGSYSFTASVSFDGKTFERTGKFVVKALKTEYLDLVAKHALLNEISTNSGGQLFYPNELDSLEQAIYQQKNIVPIAYSKKSVEDIIKWKWIFFLILLLLSLEWVLRKRNGSY